MKPSLKCYYYDGKDCFANECGKCRLLESYTDDKQRHHYGTKDYQNECPFFKTAEEAGGTYHELQQQYPLWYQGDDGKIAGV